MTQNTSHAVMQQRAEARDSLDDFPTPPWATRALCELVLIRYGWHDEDLAASTVREPACNRGYMARPLAEYFAEVWASDVHDYEAGYPVEDYLFPQTLAVSDFTITNPPFRLAADFIRRALPLTRQGVAMLVRSAFTESVHRYETLFKHTPPAVVAQFVERVPMVKGRYDPDASTATSYCWLLWDQGGTRSGTDYVWIPPCRRKLERAGDAPNS